jgi:glycosyltransferase involved in cell wall biosynthesis
MRILVATVQVPFIRGGAEAMVAETMAALREAGHDVDMVSTPFRFSPAEHVRKSMAFWSTECLHSFDGGSVDCVLCLKFPTYYLQHSTKIVWLMHQHRSVYELYDTPFGESSSTPGIAQLHDAITEQDTRSLSECRHVYTISRRVSQRLLQYNNVASTPIYQPPRLEARLYVGEPLPYIFYPSRLETLKRQELLVRAAQKLKSPCMVIIAGTGGNYLNLKSLIEQLGLSHRVRLLGHIDDQAMIRWYANALGVFFGPFDEDYGFVTLEAMLSGKPVITCTDSGGPIEFVVDHETGLIVEPTPMAVAEAIDKIFENQTQAKAMGFAGLERYRNMNISWPNVVHQLVGF